MDNRVIKYYTGELSSDERRALLREAMTNEELRKDIADALNMQALTAIQASEKDEEQGKRSLRWFMKMRRSQQRRNFTLSFLRYAAVILVCVVATFWIGKIYLYNDNTPSLMQELTIPSGQRAHITLPDGTSVWVNAASTLRYPSVFGDERRVSLSGEAFFEVAKTEKPFIVSTGKIDVKALGTKFNVFNYKGESPSVALIEGSVRVYEPNKEQDGVTMMPNQLLTYNDGKFSVQPINDYHTTWKEGIYTFNKQKFGEIVKKLELYYDVHITVTDTSILNYEYTGKFRQRDGIKEVLRLVQKIHPFHMEYKEDTNEIIIKK